jgi:hypothetical protein
LKVWAVLALAPLIIFFLNGLSAWLCGVDLLSFTYGQTQATVGVCHSPESLVDFAAYYPTLHCEVEYWLTTWANARVPVRLGVVATLLCLPWYAGLNLAIFAVPLLPGVWASLTAGQLPVTVALTAVMWRAAAATLAGLVLFGFPSALVSLIRQIACLV